MGNWNWTWARQFIQIFFWNHPSILETFAKKDSRNSWQCHSLEHCSPTVDRKETGTDREQKSKPVLQRGRSRSFLSLTDNIKGENLFMVQLKWV